MNRTLRLVSFNILEGLRPLPLSAGEQRKLDRTRSQAARLVVDELRPDILVLNEALFCRQFEGRMVDYAQIFGFPYQSAALYDDAWGNAILSRLPIVRSSEMRILDRGGLLAVLAAPAGEITVASYHPHPSRDPASKASDFVRLVSGIAGSLIVCGDFNCISPEDAIDRRHLIDAFRAFSSDPATVVDCFLESGREVFAALGNVGLKDAIPSGG